jgi:hypothetical protein
MQSSELVALLRRQTLRVRTGLWLISPNLLGDEHNEAVRLGIAAVDMRELLLGELPADTAFVMLNADRVIQLLNQVADQAHFGNCALVYNLDLLLARLTVLQRVDAWDVVFEGLSYRRSGLVLTMPAKAKSLLPSHDRLGDLAAAGRLIPAEDGA